MDLYRCILLKCLKPSAFIGKALLDINVKLSYNLRSDNDIALGEATRAYLLEKNFSDAKQKELCSSVRELYQKAAIYLKEKLEPMKCELLKAVEFCDVTQIAGMSFSSVRYVVEKLYYWRARSRVQSAASWRAGSICNRCRTSWCAMGQNCSNHWCIWSPQIQESVTVGTSYFIAATQQCGLWMWIFTGAQDKNSVSINNECKNCREHLCLEKSQNRMLSSQLLYRSLARAKGATRKALE